MSKEIFEEGAMDMDARLREDIWRRKNSIRYEYSTTVALNEKRLLLHRAVLIGDVKLAKRILEFEPELLISTLNDDDDTVLHIAARSGNVEFFSKLLKTSIHDAGVLLKTNNVQKDALHFAVISGNLTLVKYLVDDIYPRWPTLGDRVLYVQLGAELGHEGITNYLLPKSVAYMKDTELETLFLTCIRSRLYDEALILLRKNSQLAYSKYKEFSVLQLITKVEPDSRAIHLIRALLPFISAKIYEDVEVLPRSSLALHDLIRFGNDHLVRELIYSIPGLLGSNSILTSVKYKREEIFAFLTTFGDYKLHNHIDEESGNTILHIAAFSAPKNWENSFGWEPFQLMKSLNFFNVVKEKFPICQDIQNKQGKLPLDVFIEEHNDLRLSAINTISEIARNCNLVTGLIAASSCGAKMTAVSADIRKSGGFYDTFSITMSLSFVFSMTSLMMFKSIICSRFRLEDFRESLPRKLVLGSLFMFISMVGLLVAFATMIKDRVWIWTSVFCFIPIIIFSFEHLPLIRESRCYFRRIIAFWRKVYWTYIRN